jgi:hypothetical protein
MVRAWPYRISWRLAEPERYDFLSELVILLGPSMVGDGLRGRRRTRSYAYTACELNFLNITDIVSLMKTPGTEHAVKKYANEVGRGQPSLLVPPGAVDTD